MIYEMSQSLRKSGLCRRDMKNERAGRKEKQNGL